MHRFITETGNTARMAVMDLAPDRNTPVDGGRRWQPGDASPVYLLWDYHDAVDAVTRNPARYKPAAMPDVEHAALVAEHASRAEKRSTR